jgi:hypothetical protein
LWYIIHKYKHFVDIMQHFYKFSCSETWSGVKVIAPLCR